jgi:FlaA1/EpsC-like NDP-sugar epimerase
VLPIWAAQIAEGGPVTLTDPRMTRFFMTIHEAATLVIQSAAMTRPGTPAAGVYVLDMGEPVRILDLARRLVIAHGCEPLVVEGDGPGRAGAGERPEMEIRITGIRPGEKLHEELAYAAEQLAGTEHPGINLWVGDAEAVPNLGTLVASLSVARSSHDHASVISAIRRYIPTLAGGEVQPSSSQPVHNANTAGVAA